MLRLVQTTTKTKMAQKMQTFGKNISKWVTLKITGNPRL